MSDILEFLQRPLVQLGAGAIILLFAISSFSAGGSGIIIGLLLTVAGGHSVWRGFTRWQATRS